MTMSRKLKLILCSFAFSLKKVACMIITAGCDSQTIHGHFLSHYFLFVNL